MLSISCHKLEAQGKELAKSSKVLRPQAEASAAPDVGIETPSQFISGLARVLS